MLNQLEIIIGVQELIWGIGVLIIVFLLGKYYELYKQSVRDNSERR